MNRRDEWARFLTRDPLVAQTHDPYAYASNNPTNLTDPTGLAPWDDLCIRGVNCPWDTPRAIEDQGVANFAGGVLNTITFGNEKRIKGGREIHVGSKGARIAPWGNRGPGRYHLPHYHRGNRTSRGPDRT